MSLSQFLYKHLRARSSPKAVVTSAVEEADRALADGERGRPVHLPDHRQLMEEVFANTPAWVIVLDGGRFDLFSQLVGEYFEGGLRMAWNGGVGYTGDWFDRTFSDRYPDLGCFSWDPVRHFIDVSYDASDHFGVVPEIQPGRSPEQKLRDLGYLDAPGRSDKSPTAESPAQTNQTVRRHINEVEGGIIRYIKPHPPLTGLEAMTTGKGKEQRVKQALDGGELSPHDLTTAYIDTYKEGLAAAADLVPDLPGEVVLTADHGTCLTCGQVFHGRNFEKHDHLCVVPWFEVDA